MKKLFTSFISLMTIGAFGQCSLKSDNKAQSSSSTTDKQNTEKKEKNAETSSTSSSSSTSVKSSTRNQYLRVSQETWISNNLSNKEIQNNANYEKSFIDWKQSNDGQKALENAYSKSKGFESDFKLWKTQKGASRNEDDFTNSIADNSKTTQGYELYIDWTKSTEGKNKMKAIYDASTVFTDNYNNRWSPKFISAQTIDAYLADDLSTASFNAWRISEDGKDALKPLFQATGTSGTSPYMTAFNSWKTNPNNWKSKDSYIAEGISDNAFEAWIKTPDAKTSLEPLFKAHRQYYDRKYTAWESDIDGQINAYIEDDAANSLDTYNDWRITPDARVALKRLWYTTTASDGDNNFEEKVEAWGGAGGSVSELGTKQGFANDQVPPIGNEPTQLVKTMIDKIAFMNEFISVHGRSNMPSWIVSYSAFKAELKKANPSMNGAEVSFRNSVRKTFLKALTKYDSLNTPTLDAEYLKWKKGQYKNNDNENTQNSDLDLWTQNKKAITTPDIKSKFRAAIKAPNSNEKTAFDTWKNTNINRNVYLASSSFEKDLVEWAKTRKTQTTNGQDVKTAFKNAMSSPSNNGNQHARDGYDGFKEKSQNDYESNDPNDQYGLDASAWAEGRKAQTTGQDVKAVFIAPMTSTNPSDAGNSDLKGKYEDFKRPTAVKYQASSDYDAHLILYIDANRGDVAVRTAIKNVFKIASPSGGNKILQDKFVAWQPTTKENYLKTRSVANSLSLWKNTVQKSDKALQEEIAKILDDKDLRLSNSGNKALVDLLKQITQDSYSNYLLTL